ncbi:MAG: flagellar basal body rod protein FlgB [Pseudomonadota bacterium]
MNPIQKALGMSPQVLDVRAQRMELLSANIANADTPGYKARDVDFRAVMNRLTDSESASNLRRTNDQHLGGGIGVDGNAEVLFREPAQTSLDGNTVESYREHAAFMDNSVRYQASLNFLDGRIRGLRTAITGQF